MDGVMACVRGGTTYKRHNMKDGVCKGCGGVSVPAEKAEQIKQALIAKAVAAVQEKING